MGQLAAGMLRGWAEACVRQLEGRDAEATCLRSAAVARNILQAAGWQECPPWRAIADGDRPPVATDRGLGDWPHAGSIVRCVLATYTSASARCYQTCLPPSRPAPPRSCALKLGLVNR